MSKTYPAWLPILLGFLTAVGPLTTDMYLPAFPSIEASFGTAPGTAQITLATWFAGLAVGQLTQGSLSDRYGRRGPLLAGTVLYTAGRRLRPVAEPRHASPPSASSPPSPPRPAW